MTKQEYPWRDESTLREKYREEDMTMEEMGNLWSVSTRTISKWINKFDIRTGGRGAKTYAVSVAKLGGCSQQPVVICFRYCLFCLHRGETRTS
jgi:hypothetical protein